MYLHYTIVIGIKKDEKFSFQGTSRQINVSLGGEGSLTFNKEMNIELMKAHSSMKILYKKILNMSKIGLSINLIPYGIQNLTILMNLLHIVPPLNSP